MKLITNRYQQQTPTAITAEGVAISTPIYLNLTNDQSKALLNGFRNVVAEQRIAMGFADTTRQTIGELSVDTAQTPPQTQAELELGMAEESLRYALLQKGGVAERLILKLQEITGITYVTSKEVKEVQALWLKQAFSYEDNGIKTPRKTSQKSKLSKTGATVTE